MGGRRNGGSQLITYVEGNLFESPAQVLVNTVNEVGVMGKGIALEFKRICPEMFREYQELCESGKLKIGTLHLYRTPHKWVLNFPTKKHWRQPSRIEYVEAGLVTFSRIYAEAGINSVAFPPLGCGHGQLDFARQVRPLMESHLKSLPIPIFIYPERPKPRLPEHADVKAIRDWLLSEPESLPFEEVWSDVLALLEERRAFKTASKGSEYTVEAVENPPSFVIQAGKKTYKLGHEELLDFWQQLRQHGFSTRRIAPEHYRVHYLMPVFEALPYVRWAEVADIEGNTSTALQLHPRPRPAPVDEGDDLFNPPV